MLSEKPWRTNSILRLGGSVLICVFMGTLAVMIADVLAETPGANVVPVLATAAGAFGFFGGALFFLGRKWRLENSTANLLGVLLCIYPGFTLTWLAFHFAGPGSAAEGTSPLDLVLAVLGFQGAALVLVHRFLREHETRWTEAFGFNLGWTRAVLVGALAALAIYSIIFLLQGTIMRALEYFRVEPEEQMAVKVLREAANWPQQVVLAVVTILIVPPAEEALFRGILYPWIKRLGYPRLALLGTSLLFAAIHMNLGIFIPLTLLALVLVWLYEETRNLLASITAHACFNAINFAMLYAAPWLEQKLPRLFHP